MVEQIIGFTDDGKAITIPRPDIDRKVRDIFAEDLASYRARKNVIDLAAVRAADERKRGRK